MSKQTLVERLRALSAKWRERDRQEQCMNSGWTRGNHAQCADELDAALSASGPEGAVPSVASAPRPKPKPPRFSTRADRSPDWHPSIDGPRQDSGPEGSEREGGQAQGWQPIETHNGSYDPVLVADDNGVVEAYYSAEHDKWWELNSVDDGAPGSDRRVYPTHWMPLPAPPQEQD